MVLRNEENIKKEHLPLFLRLVEVTCYGSQTSLYDLETAVPSVLKPDLIDVWVSCLKEHWTVKFYMCDQTIRNERLMESKTVSCKREQGAECVNSYRVCVKCCGHWTAALAAQLPCIQSNFMFYIIKWQNIFTLASVFYVQKIWVFVCQIQLMLPQTWL